MGLALRLKHLELQALDDNKFDHPDDCLTFYHWIYFSVLAESYLLLNISCTASQENIIIGLLFRRALEDSCLECLLGMEKFNRLQMLHEIFFINTQCQYWILI